MSSSRGESSTAAHQKHSYKPVNTPGCPTCNAGFRLHQNRSRWTDVKPTSCERSLIAGMYDWAYFRQMFWCDTSAILCRLCNIMHSFQRWMETCYALVQWFCSIYWKQSLRKPTLSYVKQQKHEKLWKHFLIDSCTNTAGPVPPVASWLCTTVVFGKWKYEISNNWSGARVERLARL